jgi:hypothetical protein
MGTKIHFITGKSVELEDNEWPRFFRRFRDSGVRYYQTLKRQIIPFNSTTIEFIELALNEPMTVGEMLDKTKAGSTGADEKTSEEKYQDAEDDFLAKANCTHKNDDGSTRRSMYYAETTTGRKYFPVCDFCGHRARYVGVQKVSEGKDANWTLEDLEAAKIYAG